ncbi:hypothetical protein GGI35DRAFT_193716 [Trichoderma velutinum]
MFPSGAEWYHGNCYRRHSCSQSTFMLCIWGLYCGVIKGLEKLPNTYRCSVHRLLASYRLKDGDGDGDGDGTGGAQDVCISRDRFDAALYYVLVHVSRYMLVHGLVWSTCSYICIRQARRDDTQALGRRENERQGRMRIEVASGRRLCTQLPVYSAKMGIQMRPRHCSSITLGCITGEVFVG